MQGANRRRKTRRRAVVIQAFVITIAFAILIVHTGMVAATGNFRGKSIEQEAGIAKESQVTLLSNRGQIVDRNGHIIAEDIRTYTVSAIVSPDADKRVKDFDAFSEAIAPILGASPSFVKERLTWGLENNKYQVEFGKYGQSITVAQRKAIEKHAFEGVQFTLVTKRYYPNGTFASHTLGYTTLVPSSVDSDSTNMNEMVQQGEMGLEKYFDEQLRNQNGSVTFDRDKQGRMLPFGDKTIVP
ncbi:MAG: hypothetical protein ACRC5C_08945, partial [Bacilli bacterium]